MRPIHILDAAVISAGGPAVANVQQEPTPATYETTDDAAPLPADGWHPPLMTDQAEPCGGPDVQPPLCRP